MGRLGEAVPIDGRNNTLNTPSKLRVVMYAPHFIEYCARLAHGLAPYAKIILIVEKGSIEGEISTTLLKALRKRVRVIEFDQSPVTRADRLRTFVWFPLRLRLFSPDVAHVQEYGDAKSAAMLRLLQTLAPIVLTVHDPQPHSGSDALWFHKVRSHLDYMRDNADGFHVHGRYCEALLRQTNETTRPVLSTPHGVLFVPDDERPSQPRPGRILFFGRMQAYKGLDVFLDALDLLRQRGQTFEAIVAGAGPELDALAGRIALTPDITVRNAFLPPDEVTDLFRSCRFVVLPYTDATQSGIVAAAFGNGRPVIATRVGGLVDAVDDGRNGLTIPPNNPGALADACQTLLTSSDVTDALAAGAVRSAETDMSWDAIARDVVAFYETIVATSAATKRSATA